MSSVTETVDRMRRGELGGRAAWLVLGAAMVVSTALTLFYGRNNWFSIDEAAWISDSPQLDLGGVFEPHVGHLVAIPRLVYKVVLETTGIDYLTFRLLTVAAILLCAVLFFVWAKRRVPDFVALALTLPILLFSYDPLHLIAGNGFTVLLALACGVAALLAWDRDDRAGDLLALIFLLLGAATYTVALPFAAGLVIAAALDRRWDRIWVGLVPVVLYLAWRVLGDVSGTDPAAGGSDWTNLLLLPAWSFHGISGVLASWSGLNFNFTTSDTLPPGTGIGPALAGVALIGLGWRIATRGAGTALWLAIAIALAMWAAQTLAWGGIERYPEMPRYLYPGLIIVLLITVETVRGLNWSRAAFIALWLMTGICLMTSFFLLREKSDQLALKGDQTRAEITAVTLLGATPGGPSAAGQPRLRLTEGFNPETADDYGFLGFEPNSLLRQPLLIRNEVDTFMFESLRPELKPSSTPATGPRCRELGKWQDRYRLKLQTWQPVVIGASSEAEIRMGRFGNGQNLLLGTVGPRDPQQLSFPMDGDSPPWFISSTMPGVTVCHR